MTTENTPKFEEALSKLETIVAEMESGQISLDEGMKHFEEGMKLAKFCEAKLCETEKKIEVLMRQGNGEPEWQPSELANPLDDGR
jgi:exodeoxyribonuclease VII small subunit